jgi:hypothetical protein
MSTPIARIADGLTRQTTITPELRVAVGRVPWETLEGPLADWLENPILDWDLPLKIVTYVSSKL